MGGVRSSLHSVVGEPALVRVWASLPSSCGHATSPQASARTVTEPTARRTSHWAPSRHLSSDMQGLLQGVPRPLRMKRAIKPVRRLLAARRCSTVSVPQAPPRPVTPFSGTDQARSSLGVGHARYTGQACTPRGPLLSDKIHPLHHMPAGPQSPLPTVSSSMDTGRRCSICGLISPCPAVAQAAAAPCLRGWPT